MTASCRSAYTRIRHQRVSGSDHPAYGRLARVCVYGVRGKHAQLLAHRGCSSALKRVRRFRFVLSHCRAERREPLLSVIVGVRAGGRV
jgi:hypothetical protein